MPPGLGSVLRENKKRTKTRTLTPAREPRGGRPTHLSPGPGHLTPQDAACSRGRGEGGWPGDGVREGGGPITGQMALTSSASGCPAWGPIAWGGAGRQPGPEGKGVPSVCPRAWREPEDPALLALLSGAPALSRGTKERDGREPGLPLRPRGQPLPDLLRMGRRAELGGGR